MSIRYVCKCGTISDRRRCAKCEAEAKPWGRSNRKQRTTLSGWAEQRRARRIIARDRGRCHVCGLLGADQADHLIPLGEGGLDTEANMAAVHAEPCHREKTQREAARGRWHREAEPPAPTSEEPQSASLRSVSVQRTGP